MYAILISALFSAIGFLVRSVLVKFVVFFAMFFAVTAIMGYLSTLLPTSASLDSAFSNLGPSVWFFLDLFAVPVGFPLVVSAYLLRFFIRRLPVVG